MSQKTYMGVVIDVCDQSGGIWLDAGELEQIIQLAKESQDSDENWLTKFFGDIFNAIVFILSFSLIKS
ncbi:MAG: zf-TFIIB domain-containing protein [Bdellovibrionota bacterium]